MDDMRWRWDWPCIGGKMINLLSQEIKIQRDRTKVFRKLMTFFVVLLVLVISNYLTLYLVQNMIISHNASLTDQKTEIDLKTAKYRDLEKNIIYTNARLGLINSTTQNRAQWSSIFATFSSLTPSAIQLLSLTTNNSTIDKTKPPAYTLTISGKAKTLEDIEIFRKSLDNSGSFSGSLFKSATFNADKSDFSFGLSTSVILKPVAKK